MHLVILSGLLTLASDTINPGDSTSNFQVSITTVLYLMTTLFGIAIASPFLAMFIQNRQLQKGRGKEALEIEKKLEHHNEVVGGQLAQIHKLVNGNLLRVMRGERDAVAQALSAINGAVEMKHDLGITVLAETQAAKAQLEARLAALNEALRTE